MILKAIISIMLLLVFIVIVEIVYFYWTIGRQDPLKKSDLIVVFAGDQDRIEAGYSLAESGYGDYLAVSPAAAKKLKRYGSRYGKPSQRSDVGYQKSEDMKSEKSEGRSQRPEVGGQRSEGEKVKILIEDQARTTFENAYYIRKMVEKHRFKSVILVTSTYHLPRSYALLKIALFGTGMQIRTHGEGMRSRIDRFCLVR